MNKILGVILLTTIGIGVPNLGFASKSNGVKVNKCYKIKHKKYCVLSNHQTKKFVQVGKASFYGFESGNKTASGARFKPLGISAAHKTLPLDSKVKVTNLRNNRSIVLVINDRGPFVGNRIIDLSLGAARKIGLKGVENVKIEKL